MDRDEFARFYEQTARGLWAYLARVSGDPGLADDLCQEAFLRLLRSRLPDSADDAHRRNYLYRIATNLLRDRARSPGRETQLPETAALASAAGEDTACDVRAAFSKLRQREREILWLAYVEGATHAEIACVTGYTRMSIRPLLSRARRRLAAMLKGESS
jgi:RNA polymerase sigma-70 factor (ECF subfamily)